MASSGKKQLINIVADGVAIEGMLELPQKTSGMVLFAHGSGSSRLSPRNNYVASVLRDAGLGTLLLDLLTAGEDQTYETRFDISLLTQRLEVALMWMRQPDGELAGLPVGLFGASTGAAAALRVAARQPQAVQAVVSRGGRPDMAGADVLARVKAPTLLLVGGLDDVVIELNKAAYERMQCERQLRIVPDATHLFEEPGALESVAQMAADWFLFHLKDGPQA
ncbi:MAG TPA: hydrolase [Oxalobacteraceae bacterium]|nr:hydrolase [Oxalobacteraceae bacterium]